MSNAKKVRVRFAPSPTGGLHLGGVRTVLFNYLFAKQQGGDFILRIEDTDQSRFVPGAEEYITETLRWCGLNPDESPAQGGPFAPYRQSERKAGYLQYAEQLVQQGNAYYAFDTPQELEDMRNNYKTAENPSPQYNHALRSKMRNSVSLGEEATRELLANGTPYVIRIKMPENETVHLTDMIRGEVSFQTSQVDDKVLLKADGMPTYHLAVVVDDYLMQITHAFRGEEWLPSAPVHVLVWRYLFGEENMPQWAHLPLILKPDGNGKLSKRDGDRLGFPVFAMNWTDPRSNEFTQGFRERGFLPEAFVNMLAVLGWNDGSEQELFTLDELVQKFSMDRVHKGGAKFNYEKAKWFNQEWIKKLPVAAYQPLVKDILQQADINIADDALLTKVLELVKDRCTLLTDFVQQAGFFFKQPETIDTAAIKPKWDDKKQLFFVELIRAYELDASWEHDELEKIFKEIAAAHQIKPGDLMMPLRVMLVGGKFGPGVFDIAVLIGRDNTIRRIKHTLQLLQQA
ncbi:glutamate--tRNA ligase [Deminuibacter soli]|uniref:Glutamate--tRNA ligase n=1 Tax=Deminuibacter soli TaxID=2291815 RepID=A0A3E1NPH4_9BACT|nr:glutamate--tRNA ligase [Deminuibacter soli]RFM29688.1 glutamate--tRNA ligase [Deminuibacter soli]